MTLRQPYLPSTWPRDCGPHLRIVYRRRVIGSAARPATASSLSQLASHAALLGKSPAAQALNGRGRDFGYHPSVATLTNTLKTTGPPESADVTIDGFDRVVPMERT